MPSPQLILPRPSPPLVAQVALRVGLVAQGVHRRFEHRPAQELGARLRQRAAAVAVAGLDHAGAQAGVADELVGRRKALDLADLSAAIV